MHYSKNINVEEMQMLANSILAAVTDIMGKDVSPKLITPWQKLMDITIENFEKGYKKAEEEALGNGSKSRST